MTRPEAGAVRIAERLWRRGLTAPAIARRLEVHVGTVYEWRQRHAWPRHALSPKPTQGQMAAALALWVEGRPVLDIASITRLAHATIYRWSRVYDWPPHPRKRQKRSDAHRSDYRACWRRCQACEQLTPGLAPCQACGEART